MDGSILLDLAHLSPIYLHFYCDRSWYGGARNDRSFKVAEVPIELPESKIMGRMDLLAIHRGENTPDFWVPVVESKESGADAMQGLSQLLTYAYTGLQQQRSVWGLTTNGINYQFVQIQAGEPPQYFLLPELSLLHRTSAISLLQVLKGICPI